MKKYKMIAPENFPEWDRERKVFVYTDGRVREYEPLSHVYLKTLKELKEKGYTFEEIEEDGFTTVYPEINTTGIWDPPDGGPAAYYDFPEGAITLNDLIEHRNMDFHLGNIFKACWRWGTKQGTSKEYDAKKILYSAARILKRLSGTEAVRKELQRLLDDPQFMEKK